MVLNSLSLFQEVNLDGAVAVFHGENVLAADKSGTLWLVDPKLNKVAQRMLDVWGTRCAESPATANCRGS